MQRLNDKEDFQTEAVSTDEAFWAENDFMEDYEDSVTRISKSLMGMFA